MELIDHPKHYNLHPSGIEAIQIIRTMSFDLGSAFKYVFRRDDKGNPVQDLKKAFWLVHDELVKRQQWKYTLAAKLLRPFYLFTRQDVATQYWERTAHIRRVCRCESEPIISDIYKLLNQADFIFYDTHSLELVKTKLLFIIDKYETIEHIKECSDEN